MNSEDEKELEDKKILNDDDYKDYEEEDDEEDDEEEEDDDEDDVSEEKSKDSKKMFDFKNKNHRIGAIVALGVFVGGGFYYVKNKNSHVDYEQDNTSQVINHSNDNQPIVKKENNEILKNNDKISQDKDNSKNNNVELLDTDNINDSLNKVNIDSKDLPKLKKPSDDISNSINEERIKNIEDKLSSIEVNSSKIEELSNRVSELEKKVELIEKTDSLIQDIVNERQAMEKNKEEQAIKDKIEKEGNVNINVPEFSEGKSRLIGFKILPISNDPNIILVSDANNNIVGVSKDIGFNYKGKILKIENISDDGKIVNFENNVFVDTTLGFGGLKNQNVKVNENKTEIKNIIKKENIKSNFQDLNNIRGVAITKDSNNEKYTVTVEDKNNNSEMTSLKEGDYFKNFGKVKKIDDSGNVYFSKGKINFSR